MSDHNTSILVKERQQGGAELGQAQLKLEMELSSF